MMIGTKILNRFRNHNFLREFVLENEIESTASTWGKSDPSSAVIHKLPTASLNSKISTKNASFSAFRANFIFLEETQDHVDKVTAIELVFAITHAAHLPHLQFRGGVLLRHEP